MEIFSTDEKDVNALLEVEWEDGLGPKWMSLESRSVLKLKTGGITELGEFFRSRLVLSDLVAVDFLARKAENGEPLKVRWDNEQVSSLAGEKGQEWACGLEVVGEFKLNRWNRTTHDYVLELKLKEKPGTIDMGWCSADRIKANSIVELEAGVLRCFRTFLKNRAHCNALELTLKNEGWQLDGGFSEGVTVELPIGHGDVEISWYEHGVFLRYHDEEGETVWEKLYTEEPYTPARGIEVGAEANFWGDLRKELDVIQLLAISC